MRNNSLGKLFEVSALTLGGGGIGQVWGETSQEEAIATVRDAYSAGIRLFDMAPLYGDGEAERVMGLAFADGYPADLRLTTKCMVGAIPREQIEARLRDSLTASLARLARDYVDVYILHGYIIPDGWQATTRPRALPHIAVEYSTYRDIVIPVFESLMASGKIGAFGITAASTQVTNVAAVENSPAPALVQCIANVLDSPGNMAITEETAKPREVIQASKAQGVGVMGIRAVAAGALATAIDRVVKPNSAEAKDFARAGEFRRLAAAMDTTPAKLAHRYALSMPGVDTVVLGVKTRHELLESLQAEAQPRFTDDEMKEIDQQVTG
jgi:aryl-alcohol dehydrogenase-like predicted oxidoreductase